LIGCHTSPHYAHAHARGFLGQIDPRKFFDIHTAQGSGIAKEALERIADLYRIEATIRGDPPDKRRAARQKHATPLIDDLEAWLRHGGVNGTRESDFAQIQGNWAPRNADLAFAISCLEGTGSPLPVPLDIKPASCPNPLNVKSKGVLPVAILGTVDFDVTEVDVTTVTLEGVGPLRSNLEDVATPFQPFTGKEDALDCYEDAGDGRTDLTLKFDWQAVVGVLGPVNDGDVVVVAVSGKLLDGTSFEGEDVIVIKTKGKK